MSSRKQLARLLVAKLAIVSFAFAALPGPLASGQEPGAAGSSAVQPVLPPTASSAATRVPEDYLISPEDLLDIYIMDVPELSRQYRVTPSGRLVFPLLPSAIKAEGLTPDEISKELASALRANGLVSNPHISVTVKESRLHSVAIAGAVKKPQIYPVFGRTNLLDILSLGGGLDENAGSVVRITRGELGMRAVSDGTRPGAATGAGQQSFTIDLKRLLETGDPELNVAVYPGDSVTVPMGGVVYVVGAVNKPGGFVLSTQRQGLTVTQALALAENPKDTAIKDRALVVRRGEQYPGGRQEIAINLRTVMAGNSPDVVLQPNDILYIPESSSRKALRRGADAAIQMLIGAVIWRL
jgi:polysaccharide export outer membrane protein